MEKSGRKVKIIILILIKVLRFLDSNNENSLKSNLVLLLETTNNQGLGHTVPEIELAKFDIKPHEKTCFR